MKGNAISPTSLLGVSSFMFVTDDTLKQILPPCLGYIWWVWTFRTL